MFISPAYAQAAGEVGANPVMPVIFQFVLIFAVFYFLLIRPQSQKAKQHNIMLDNIKKGDVVVTSGGMIATVVKELGEDELSIQLCEGVKVKVLRRTIRDALDKEGNSILEQKPTSPVAKKEDVKQTSSKEKKSESKKSKKSDALKKALSD